MTPPEPRITRRGRRPAAPRILRNRAECASCHDVIESLSVHHHVTCRCGATFVDGGLEYLRRGWRGAEPIELSVVVAMAGDHDGPAEPRPAALDWWWREELGGTWDATPWPLVEEDGE